MTVVDLNRAVALLTRNQRERNLLLDRAAACVPATGPMPRPDEPRLDAPGSDVDRE